MKEVEGNSRGVKRPAQERLEGNKEPKKDLFEPPIKRSHKEQRFQSNSQEEDDFRNKLKSAWESEKSNPLPESETDSDESDETVCDSKEKDEDFS